MWDFLVLKMDPEKVRVVRLMKGVTRGRREGMLPIMMAMLRSMPAQVRPRMES